MPPFSSAPHPRRILFIYLPSSGSLSIQWRFPGGVSTSRLLPIRLAVSLGRSWKTLKCSLYPEPRVKVARCPLRLCLLSHSLLHTASICFLLFWPLLFSLLPLYRWLCLDWGAICSITPTARASIPFFCSRSRGYGVGNRFFVGHTNSSWHSDSPICHGRQKQKAFELEKHNPVIALYNQMEKKNPF